MAQAAAETPEMSAPCLLLGQFSKEVCPSGLGCGPKPPLSPPEHHRLTGLRLPPACSKATAAGVEGCAQQSRLGQTGPRWWLHWSQALSKGSGEGTHILCGQRWWREQQGHRAVLGNWAKHQGKGLNRVWRGQGFGTCVRPVPASKRVTAGSGS